MASKPEFHYCSGMSMAATYLLAMRCPVLRGRDPHLGFRTELENLCKVPMHCPGADSSVVVMKRGNARRAKGGGHPHRDRGPTDNRRSSGIWWEAAAFLGWHEPYESRGSRTDL